MWWYLLILFPALVAIVWSVVVKVRVKAWRDMVDMLVCAVAAVVNVLFVCFAFQHDSLPTCGLLIRQLVSVIILPVAYSFFARQLSMGKWDTVITTLLWSSLILFILPGWVIYLGFTGEQHRQRSVPDSSGCKHRTVKRSFSDSGRKYYKTN